MNKIDWTKPVRMQPWNFPIKVITTHGEGAYVTWGGEAVGYAADRNGKLFGRSETIENVPEEPKDTLRLYKVRDGQWIIENDGKPMTWTEAERYRNETITHPSIRKDIVNFRVLV